MSKFINISLRIKNICDPLSQKEIPKLNKVENFLGIGELGLLDDAQIVLRLFKPIEVLSSEVTGIIAKSLFSMPNNDHWRGVWASSFRSWESFYRDSPQESWISELENLAEIEDIFNEIHRELLLKLMLLEFMADLKKIFITNHLLSIRNVEMIEVFLKKVSIRLFQEEGGFRLIRENEGVFWCYCKKKLEKNQSFAVEKLMNCFLIENDCKLFLN